MSRPSPIPAYVLGVGSILLGLHAYISPTSEYPRFGLPLEHSANTGDEGYASPLMYLKAIREATYGLALVALQYQGYDGAVTTLAAVLSLAGLGDGFVVWNFGGEELRVKAWGHWAPFVVFVIWAKARVGMVKTEVEFR
ncbi:Fc.00g067960.m01.CDS01 [Cosmosporella sp. VM-42]